MKELKKQGISYKSKQERSFKIILKYIKHDIRKEIKDHTFINNIISKNKTLSMFYVELKFKNNNIYEIISFP